MTSAEIDSILNAEDAPTQRQLNILFEVAFEDSQRLHALDALQVQEAQNGGIASETSDEPNYNIANSFFDNPQQFGERTPLQLYDYLKANGFKPLPLGGGSYINIPFEQGGGYRLLWGGDRILLYHPATRSHHGGAYYKLSSGPTGTMRFNLDGTFNRR